jgi:hypothetical protein
MLLTSRIVTDSGQRKYTVFASIVQEAAEKVKTWITLNGKMNFAVKMGEERNTTQSP